jgi:hypothetical protein
LLAPELAAVRMLAWGRADPQAQRLALDACNPSALRDTLSEQQLLGLLGSRALEAWGHEAPQAFAEAVATKLAADRARGLALEAISAEFVMRIEAAGVRVLVLKGPLLAQRLHGDVGSRASNDVDLLVARADLDAAARALAPRGYLVETTTPLRSHGHTYQHIVLRSPSASLPRIDLHWRVHWYEEDFSLDLLARSRKNGETFLAPDPLDEIAMLMLFYARDGFYGLRKAVDIAAWYERSGLNRPQPLERHWREYPRLRPALAAAAVAAEYTVGVPARSLVPQGARVRLRSRLAANLASWSQLGDIDQLRANVAVVDVLLSPPGELRHFARRELFVTRNEIEHMYGLSPSARRRVTALRLVHAPKVTLRFIAGLWSALRSPRRQSVGEELARSG